MNNERREKLENIIFDDLGTPPTAKALDQIEALFEGWVSVKERLPEYGLRVLCYYTPKQPIMEGRTMGILRRIELPKQAEHMRRLLDDNDFELAAEVTHWKSIEPPKP